MKAIIVDFSSGKNCDIVVGLARKSVEILYWIGKKNPLVRLKESDRIFFSKTIFHDTYDAVAGLPATNVDVSKFPPVSANLLMQMLPYEAQTLSMMTKLDNKGASLIEMSHLYYKFILYWHGVLSQMSPDVIIFPDVPHIVYNYIIYRLAKVLGIKTVMFKRINAVPDRVLFFENFENYKELKSEFERVKNDGHISDAVCRFYSQFNKIDSNNRPEQYRRFTGLSGKEKGLDFFPKLSSIIKNFRQMTFLKATAGYFWALFHKTAVLGLTPTKVYGLSLKIKNFKYKRICRGFKKEYEQLQVIDVDLNQPFIYVPLHRQPEGTSNPMGGIFDDQLLMLEMLSSSLPIGWKLYVKEHPSQWKFPLSHQGRYRGYYDIISKHKNIILISVKNSGFDLLAKCKAVATVTGTTGMEAILKGKPALVFGHPVYGDCEGAFKIDCLEVCIKVIEEIKNGFVPDQKNVLAFLQAIDNIAAAAFIHKRHGLHSAFTHDQSVKNIVDKLYSMCLS